MAGANIKSSSSGTKVKVYSSGTSDGRKVKNFLRPAANDDYIGASPFFFKKPLRTQGQHALGKRVRP